MYIEKVVICAFYCLFMVIHNFPATHSLKNKDKPCHQFTACKCIFPTGSGINLTPINQNLSAPSNPGEIHLHLCQDVSFGEDVPSNQCFHNVSVCYKDASPNTSLSLGKAGNMKFISKSQYQPISLQFNNTDNITNIALVCDQAATSPELIYMSKEGSIYNLELHSQHACLHSFSTDEGPSGGLSTGSVLVIMLLVFTLVYFGGGMLTLKLLRGAEGKEMIPNIDFWMDLPYLVRDGVLFTLNGFRPPTTYDRI